MDVMKRLEVVEPPTRESLADQVAVILKRFILLEELEPGSRMPPERRLADTLNVSRTVLREALNRLIGEGLLARTSPRVLEVAECDREKLVASMSPFEDREAHFRDLMELRYILEMGALPVVIRKITPDSLVELERWVDTYETQMLSGNPSNAIDAQFHVALLRIVGNPTIDSLLPLIENQIREYLLFDPHVLGESVPASGQRVISEHREILEAIRSGNPLDALAAMERHLSPYFVAMRRGDHSRAPELAAKA